MKIIKIKAKFIIVLNEGSIVGIGTHNELMNDCEIYKEIVKSQLSDKEFEKELKDAR